MRVCPTCFALFGPDQLECPKDVVPTKHYTEVLVGMHLGPYVVRSLISEGGMGVVYAGEHPTLGRRVALKVLRPELSLRDDIVERFTQEARSVNTIGHANIVNIYDFGRTPFGTFYIVMEYLEGRTLRQLLDLGGPQPLERVSFVVEAIGAALASAHSKGFIHRDVKPENIMVGSRSGAEWVKLLDFGIAKLLTGGNTTATSGVMGTPQYMSPEQLEDGKVDHRTDIYSLAGLVYELLTGQVPYSGTTQAAVRQAQLTRNPPPPGMCRKDIHLSASTDDAVLRGMALDPQMRFQRVEEFLEAFRAGVADTAEERSTISRRPADSQRRHPWMIFAISGVFAVLLGTGIAFALLHFMRHRQVTDPPKKQTSATNAKRDQGVRTKAVSQKQAMARARKIVDAAFAGASAPLAVKFAEIVQPIRLRKQLNAALQSLATRRHAARTLGNLPRDTSTIEALSMALKKSSRFAAVDIAVALGKLGEPAIARATLTRLQAVSRTSLLLRRYVLIARVPYSSAAAGRLEKLERAQDWGWAQIRGEALASLARRGNRWARDELERTIKAGPWQRRLIAAQFYAQLPDATIARLTGLLGEPSKRSQLRAWRAGILAGLGDADAAKTLVECLGSGDSGARTRCALELGRLQHLRATSKKSAVVARQTVVDGLAAALASDSIETRLAAAIALHAY